MSTLCNFARQNLPSVKTAAHVAGFGTLKGFFTE